MASPLSIVKDNLRGSGGGGAIADNSTVDFCRVRCVEDKSERGSEARSTEEGGISTKTRRLACDFWLRAGTGAEALSVAASCVRKISAAERLRRLSCEDFVGLDGVMLRFCAMRMSQTALLPGSESIRVRETVDGPATGGADADAEAEDPLRSSTRSLCARRVVRRDGPALAAMLFSKRSYWALNCVL